MPGPPGPSAAARRRRAFRRERERILSAFSPLDQIGGPLPASRTLRSGVEIVPGGSMGDVRPRGLAARGPTLVAPEIPFTKKMQRIADRQQRETAKYMGGLMPKATADVLNIPLGGALAIHGTIQDAGAAATRLADMLDENRKGPLKGNLSFKHSRETGKQVVEGSVDSILHPGKDPAATLLTVFGVLSLGAGTVAKLSVVSRLAAEGRFAEAASAMGRMPPPGKRIFKNPEGETVRGYYSRAGLSRAWQKSHDWYIQKAAVKNPEGKVAGYLQGRMNREARKNQIVERALGLEDIPAAPADQLKLMTGGTGKAVAAWDTMNDAAKMALIYAKIGYIPPNFIGNAVLNVIQQGHLALPNLARAAKLSRSLTPEEVRWLDEVSGAGISKALVDDSRNPLSKVAHKMADLVSIPTDRYTRRSSILYEFDRAGYGGTRGFRMLKNNPSHRGNLIEAVQRGRENAIEYENLNSFERTAVNRLIFIYPWIKGSATYTGRFIRDHPIQASVAYQLGDQGRKYSKDFFGPKPSYMEGIIPGKVLGLGKNVAVDPRGASSFGTWADVLGTAAGIPHGKFADRSVIANWLPPQISELAGYAFGFDPNSRNPLRSGRNPAKYLWDTFLTKTPQAAAIGAIKGTKPQPTGIMQRTRAESLARIGLGSIGPSTISKANLNRKGVEEAVSLLPNDKRAVYYSRRSRDEMELALVKAKVPKAIVNGKLEPRLAKAWELYEQRKLATVDIRRPPRGANKQQLLDYQREAVTAEVDTAIRLKLMDPSKRKVAVDWANKTTDVTKIKSFRRYIAHDIYAGGYIADVRKWARDNYKAEF